MQKQYVGEHCHQSGEPIPKHKKKRTLSRNFSNKRISLDNQNRDNLLQGHRILAEMLRLERNFEAEKHRFLSEHEYTVPELFSLFADSTAAKLSADEVMLGLKVFGMI